MQVCSSILLGLCFLGVPAYSTSFELIVPSAVTVNTSGANGRPIFFTLLVASQTTIDFDLQNDTMVPIVPLNTLGRVSSDNPDVRGNLSLSVYGDPTCQMHVGADCAPLTTGQVRNTPRASRNAGFELLDALILPSEQLVPWQATGLGLAGLVFWPDGNYTGSATLDVTFAIGQDVASYSLLVTFVGFSGLPDVNITAAQRVASVFDPDFVIPPPLPVPPPGPTPEPASFSILGIGLALVAVQRKWPTIGRRCIRTLRG